MFGLSLYRNENHKRKTLVIFGRHYWFRSEQTEGASVRLCVCIISKCHISYFFIVSDLLHFKLRLNAALSLFPPSRQGNTDEERGKHCGVSPAPLSLLTICGFQPLHPPSSPSVSSSHVGCGWIVRVEDCSGSEWKLCWLIPGAARAPPSLWTISTLLQGKKSHAEIQAGSRSAFGFLLERTCSGAQLGSNLSHHVAQWNLTFPWRNVFQLIQLTHVSYKLRRDWWMSKLLHQSYDYQIGNKNKCFFPQKNK